jgi:hypothetical protein
VPEGFTFFKIFFVPRSTSLHSLYGLSPCPSSSNLGVSKHFLEGPDDKYFCLVDCEVSDLNSPLCCYTIKAAIANL